MIFKNRYFPTWLNVSVLIFSIVCDLIGLLLFYNSFISTFSLIVIITISTILYQFTDYNLKESKHRKRLPLPIKTDGSPLPSMWYLLKEGFITAEISEKRWDGKNNKFSIKVDLFLNDACPPLKIGKSEDGCVIISYMDGSGELKITNEVLEQLKSES